MDLDILINCYTTTTSKEDSIKLLLILFSHGFTWFSGSVIPEFTGNILDKNGNNFYFHENKWITYGLLDYFPKNSKYFNIQKILNEF